MTTIFFRQLIWETYVRCYRYAPKDTAWYQAREAVDEMMRDEDNKYYAMMLAKHAAKRNRVWEPLFNRFLLTELDY